jgi:hypothetical protein
MDEEDVTGQLPARFREEIGLRLATRPEHGGGSQVVVEQTHFDWAGRLTEAYCAKVGVQRYGCSPHALEPIALGNLDRTRRRRRETLSPHSCSQV